MIHVVGAGIAGSAAALALHGVGAEVVVHEAHPDAGAFLTLAENGMRALQAIGAGEAVLRASAPLRTMFVSDSAATELASRSLGEPGGPAFRYLTRARLCAVLQDEVRRRGIPLRHGERLVATAPDGDGIEAVLANGTRDGTRVRGDLLVGADGLRSTVRTQLDPGAAPPRYIGSQIFYGATPTRRRRPPARGRPWPSKTPSRWQTRSATPMGSMPPSPGTRNGGVSRWRPTQQPAPGCEETIVTTDLPVCATGLRAARARAATQHVLVRSRVAE